MIDKSSTMIRTCKLTKVYGNGTATRALNEVDLTIMRGEFVTITGPSGSGKSTLLNMIGALDVPTSGQVYIDGIDSSRLNDDALADLRRKKIGFIFQLFNLVPALTALENVMLPLIPYRRQCGFDLEKRAGELLARVGLGAHLGRLPSELSGGEQQRVAIARALINGPQVILADEPTGNLDSHNGTEVMELLCEMNERHGLTLVVVTHDLALASRAPCRFRLVDGVLSSD